MDSEIELSVLKISSADEEHYKKDEVVDPLSEENSLDSGCDDSSESEGSKDFFLVRAVYDYNAKSDVELSLTTGDILTIHTQTSDCWWWGEKNGTLGYIPVNHITTSLENDNKDWQDEHYYEIYGHLQVHFEMLSDKARTLAYLEAIRQNEEFITGKSVMDVGCGTGILSLFLARDGHAAKVFAVEASESSKIAKCVTKFNGYDQEIAVFESRVEDVQITEAVDLIISEWMGTFLISEFMIESVIKARDKFLKSTGKIWPSAASLHFAPCTLTDTLKAMSAFWDDIYGFDFSVLRQMSSKYLTNRPLPDNISKDEDLLALSAMIFKLDMSAVTVDEIEHVIHEFNFTVTKPGAFSGFCTWFCVEFEDLVNLGKKSVILDTGPLGQLTHWKHPFLLLDTTINVLACDKILGTVELKRNAELRRHLSLKLTGQIQRKDSVLFTFDKEFKCWE